VLKGQKQSNIKIGRPILQNDEKKGSKLQLSQINIVLSYKSKDKNNFKMVTIQTLISCDIYCYFIRYRLPRFFEFVFSF
jgi:hypothetical protein